MAERTPDTSNAAPVSVRARLARMGSRSQSGNPVLEPLFRVVRTNHPKADLALLARAYEVAEHWHGDQKRKSGEPYITHPLAVTTILAELGMTEAVLVAGLLHDLVEDTPYSLEDCRRDFGDEVALFVDGVTKLDKVKYGDAAPAETLRKMIVAMSADIRILVIKLADRLHNMRTLRYLKPETQARKATETLEIFAPLAHRLGMNTIKWELEDLAFSTLHPKLYDEIVRLVAERAPSRDQVLREVIAQVEEDLRTQRIKATVTGRPKHYYSIYQKKVQGGRAFTDIYDLVGIRILVDERRTCYDVLGILHDRFQPIPGRFKDYIATPKFNLYQSLHTSVIGPTGKPIEMQIRSWEMHQTAEFGVAAHWKYKDGQRVPGSGGERVVGEADLPWLGQIMEFQKELQDSGEFLDELRYQVNAKQVYVFTPRGEIKQLPVDSTPVDFAYAVHTEVGHHTMGARVNGRLVPLDARLDNGDTVEVFTSKAANSGPSQDWLQFVVSPRARSKIKAWFSKERRDEAIEQGRDEIAKLLRKQNVSLKRVLTHESLTHVARDLHLADVEGLYAAVGEGSQSAQSVVRKVLDLHGGVDGAGEDLAEATSIIRPRRQKSTVDAGVIVKGVSGVMVKLARCCTPVPGDDILGFNTRSHIISVHRRDCTNVAQLLAEPERIIDVAWDAGSQSSFLVQVMVEAMDRERLLSDITRVLADQRLNILSAALSTDRHDLAKARFTFEMGDPKHLGSILREIRSIDDVYDAYRVTS